MKILSVTNNDLLPLFCIDDISKLDTSIKKYIGEDVSFNIYKISENDLFTEYHVNYNCSLFRVEQSEIFKVFQVEKYTL